MSVWYWIAVWVGASPIVALFMGQVIKLATPPSPGQRLVSEVEAYLAGVR